MAEKVGRKSLTFDYYYGQEAEHFSFYRIPRLLIKDGYFKGLSSDAKILYGLMLDRLSLSMKKGWLDEKNRVYIIYTMQCIQDDLGCAKQKAVKVLAELDSVKGIGLIEKKRVGLGHPDIIYVKNFVIRDEKPNNELQEAGIQEDSESYHQRYENHTSESMEIKPQEVCKSYFSRYEDHTSGGMNIKPAQVWESNPNYTDNSYTENSQIDSIHPIENEGVIDEDEALLSIIRDSIDFERHMKYDDDGDRQRYEELYHVIADTIRGHPEKVCIGDSVFQYEAVRSRLLKLTGEHLEYVRQRISKNVGEIRNMKRYMLAALYNAPATMGTYYTQLVRHDMYGGGWEESGIV